MAAQKLRADVVRGLRWGAILIIAGLLGVVALRVLRDTPAQAMPPAPAEPAATSPIPAPVEDAVRVGKTEEAKPVRTPASRTVDSIPVPAPPPLHAIQPVAVRESERGPMPQVAPQFTEAPEFPVVETAPPTPVVTNPAGGPVLAGAPPEAKQDGNRATKIVRGVGRFLRLGGKKDDKGK